MIGITFLEKFVNRADKPIGDLKLARDGYKIRDKSAKTTRNRDMKSLKLGISKESKILS